MCLYIKFVSSLVEIPTDAIYLRMSIRIFDGILITLFHPLGVDSVQQSALNKRYKITTIYSTAKRQKKQNDKGPGKGGGGGGGN